MSDDNLTSKVLKLPEFFAYKLAVFSTDVSRSMAQLYSGRFNLSRQEWRVLAVLGEQEGLSAKEIASDSTLDKTQVSRATASLLKEGLIDREEDNQDRRHLRHKLSRKGQSIYREIVPLVLAREEYILSALSQDEAEELDRLMGKIHGKALELQKWG